jgi:RNA polymerase sigma factor (sigma-70 family)
MKIPNIDSEILAAAVSGQLKAIDGILVSVQPGVYNLAVRMLGNRDDAADASQEILLKVVTHLASFRAQSAFSTWVFQIARNHLLTAITRSKESPEVSLDSIADRLQQGLEYGQLQLQSQSTERPLTPEDKLEARQIALGCTQNMLLALDREQRLAYILDAVFGLSSEQAGEVLDIEPTAYRKRISRARETLDTSFNRTCGLSNPNAACRCEKQLPTVRMVNAANASKVTTKLVSLVARVGAEMLEAERHFDALLRMSDAAAILRAHPEYQAPQSMAQAIRSVLTAEGYWRADDVRSLQ